MFAAFILAAAVSLYAAGRLWYALSATFAIIFGGIALWSKRSSKCPALVTRLFVGFVHLIGTWFVPCFVWYGVRDLYPGPVFVNQEVGHLVAATILMIPLAIVPLWIAPKGYHELTLDFQKVEAYSMFLMGFVQILYFRIGYHFTRHGDLNSKDWEHDRLTFVWMGSGILGVLLNRNGLSSNTANALPVLIMYYIFLGHNHGDSSGFLVLWTTLHQVCAKCFFLAGLCRLLHRMFEYVCFSFLAAFFLLNASRGMAESWYDSFHGHGEEDGTVVRITVLNVTVYGILFFAVQVFLFGQLRVGFEDYEKKKAAANDAVSREDVAMTNMRTDSSTQVVVSQIM